MGRGVVARAARPPRSESLLLTHCGGSEGLLAGPAESVALTSRSYPSCALVWCVMAGRIPELVPDDWRAVINPWVRDAELARALILRSAILWSYSHVEQKLTDIVVRCSHEAAYRDVAAKPPSTSAKRVKFLRAVLSIPGPLYPFRSLGVSILNRYDASRPIRNRMAHADMEVYSDWGVVFDEIVVSGSEISHHRSRYWPGRLEAEARRAARFSKAVQRVHYAMVGNDPISGPEGEPISVLSR